MGRLLNGRSAGRVMEWGMAADTPFHNLDEYLAIPRVGGLALSADGTRLVTSVQALGPDRTSYVSSLWEVDPTGASPARRLTRSAKGESSAVFTRTGDLLFTSSRPDPDAKPDDDAPGALWLLPAAGGEARVIASAPGGVGGPLVAADADTVSVTADVLHSAPDLAADEKLRGARKELKVAAILHTGYPVRSWDHDLGPEEERRFVGDLASLADVPASPLPDPEPAEGEKPARKIPAGQLQLRQITTPGRGLRDATSALTPDGTTLVTTWSVGHPGAAVRNTLVAIDTATGESRVLVDDPTLDVWGVSVSRDGKWAAYVTESITTSTESPVSHLAMVPVAGGTPTVLVPEWDRWVADVPVWLADGSGLLVVADDDGRAPVFLVTLEGTPAVQKVTSDAAAFSSLQVTSDGSTAYALRSSYAAPAEPVRIDLAAFRASGAPVAATLLRGPVAAPSLPGTLTEVETIADDGVRIRSWLVLPEGASAEKPAPLLLWIHGGPLSSWNAWSWRWNPWLMAAKGYAVLLPDPALSTGYGRGFIQRGWGAWGERPYTDLMAATDAAIQRPDIDETRTAAMGGSFGGYMANWVAGHTDRFRAIVTHASLWALDQFSPTTDGAFYWVRELSPEMAQRNSPHLSVGSIRTPMLVVHGDRDYRVPIGDGLRLWFDLLTASGLPAADDGSTVHRFLYFPNENHWVLKPQHSKVWYEVVLGFLGEHVLGEAPTLPEVLG